ncbi:MAG: histidine phosphatase family protein [Phyllobacterium sp.]
MTVAFYITHPEVQIDASVPVPQWGLSERGRQRARQAALLPFAMGLERIVSSDERKAVETGEILAGAAGLSVEVMAGMGENDRSATGFLPPPEFEATADRFFAEPEISIRGWERAIDAQSRIVSAVETVLANHSGAPIAFIGHGGVGTLLKCALKGIAISRQEDQKAGGGHVYAFSLADRSILFDWRPMETIIEGVFHG